MKKYLTIPEADQLFEKYYEGETSGAEEELLQAFLEQDNLPERFDAERALFGYFAQEKKPKRNLWLRLNPVLKWTVAAAVLVTGVFLIDQRLQTQSNDLAYVNGVRCTDAKQVTALALASIDQLDLGSDEVAGTVDKMNDADLVESQLQAFPELK